MLIPTDRAPYKALWPTAHPDQHVPSEREWVPMAADESQSDPDAEALAHSAADRLALTLEEVGFDVGMTFPGLHGTSDRSGTPTVHLGSVTPAVAMDLAEFLADAVRLGVALPLQ